MLSPGRHDELWAIARYRADVLDRVLASDASRHEAIGAACSELRLSRARIYQMLGAYERERSVSSLLPKPRRRSKRLDAEVEAIINAALTEIHLVKTAPPLIRTVEEIALRCAEQGFAAPAYETVKARLRAKVDEAGLTAARSYNEDRAGRLQPRPGKIKGERPRQLYQIDHTKMDVMIVDVDGNCVGRPWLTSCRDVATRMVVGYYLSLDHPNSVACALCLVHAMSPKTMTLERFGVPGEWPAYGRPENLQTDGGKDFNSAAFARGCEDIRIRLDRRDRWSKHRGAVVEREFGSIASMTSGLNGKTGRSIEDRDRYPSTREACLRLEEVEEILVRYIVGVANERPREPDFKSSLTRWKDGDANAAPVIDRDPRFARCSIEARRKLMRKFGSDRRAVAGTLRALSPREEGESGQPERRRRSVSRRQHQYLDVLFSNYYRFRKDYWTARDEAHLECLHDAQFVDDEPSGEAAEGAASPNRHRRRSYDPPFLWIFREPSNRPRPPHGSTQQACGQEIHSRLAAGEAMARAAPRAPLRLVARRD